MFERTQWGHIFFVVNNVPAKEFTGERLQIVYWFVNYIINKNQVNTEVKKYG